VYEEAVTENWSRKEAGHVQAAVSLPLEAGDSIERLFMTRERTAIPAVDPGTLAERSSARMHEQAPD
jgi:hypothetical protein